MAAEAALLDGLGEGVIRCPADGGCKEIRARRALVCIFGGQTAESRSSNLGTATNNIGELRAIEIALEHSMMPTYPMTPMSLSLPILRTPWSVAWVEGQPIVR